MVRNRAVLLLSVVACLLAVASGAADDKAATKIKGWGEVTDPDRDCKVALVKDRLTVKVPGTAHDFAAELQRLNAPRVMGKVQGDFIAEVKVSGEFKPSEKSTIDGRRPYNGAGLLLVKDDNNYVSLHRGAVTLETGVRHYLNFELRKDGALTVSRYEVELEDKDALLRLERRGDKVFALTSPDGLHWKAYDDPIEIDFPEALRLGVEAVSSSDQPFACTLEGFAVFQRVNGEASRP
jgi:regulation of enolase protein 1 (concanavalin A-like superfamily)